MVTIYPQHAGLMDPCRYVAVTSTTAARVFNIYPQKVGKDIYERHIVTPGGCRELLLRVLMLTLWCGILRLPVSSLPRLIIM